MFRLLMNQIAMIDQDLDVPFLVPKLVIWQACCLHFGIVGKPGTIEGHLGLHETGACDSYRFGEDVGSSL